MAVVRAEPAVFKVFAYGDVEIKNPADISAHLDALPTAALDVVVYNTSDLDPDHICIPASYEGVPMEQDVIETIVPDGSEIF